MGYRCRAARGRERAGNPTALDGAPTRIKLFFELQAEDRYAELFLNVDVREGSIQLSEKDFDYRRAVVQALAGT